MGGEQRSKESEATLIRLTVSRPEVLMLRRLQSHLTGNIKVNCHIHQNGRPPSPDTVEVVV